MNEPTQPSQEGRSGWGGTTRTVSHVVYPTSEQDVVAAVRDAAERGWKVAPWGNGRSYGDAMLNEGQVVLDLGRMNRILAYEPDTGLVTVQPGVTIEQLWQRVVVDGWWPPVVSGTMFTTLGGCAAANVHGKNNASVGPLGEHIRCVQIVLADGAVKTLTPETEPNLFHAAIGGMGWLGVFTQITLQLTRVHSGRLTVQPEAVSSLDGMFRSFDRYERERWDYVVGWVDAFARGHAMGRGQVHAARYLDRGADPEGERMLTVGNQVAASSVLGVPKSALWRFMRPLASRMGMRLVNAGRFFWANQARNQQVHLDSHARFNFLLDYVPNWKRIYGRTGLIQVQLFVPEAEARRVFGTALQLQQALGLESWLAVMKRHRADAFWLSHAVDGYSLALDFAVTDKNREQTWRMAKRMEDLVVEAGGRFYFAKDSVVSPESVRKSLGDQVLGRFLGLKRQVDPTGLFESNLFRRVVGPLQGQVTELPLGDGEVFAVPVPERIVAEPVVVSASATDRPPTDPAIDLVSAAPAMDLPSANAAMKPDQPDQPDDAPKTSTPAPSPTQPDEAMNTDVSTASSVEVVSIDEPLVDSIDAEDDLDADDDPDAT